MSLDEAIAAAPDTPRAQAAARLVREAYDCVTTAEDAAGNDDAAYWALPRRQRRLLNRLPQALAYFGAYLHDLGFELEVTLVDAGQARAGTDAAAAAAAVDAVRAALAELEAVGLRDLRPGLAAVALRCEAMRRFGLPAAQSLLFLQRIRHDYGERLAANLGDGAVEELTDSLVRSIAAVAAPAEATAASGTEG